MKLLIFLNDYFSRYFRVITEEGNKGSNENHRGERMIFYILLQKGNEHTFTTHSAKGNDRIL